MAHTTAALQGFTIYQPTLGAALQFMPALGSAELDAMIQAFLPGPASIKDKRATVCMDFYEFAGRTGETMKFYPVFPAVYTPVNTNSPVGSDYTSAFSASPVVNDVNMWSFTTPSTPSSVAAATPSSSQAAPSERKTSLVARSRQDFSHMPGMKILTKDGLDVTNSATRGSKTKEQRDHAHLMRIIKACDACKKRKTRCDPSHKKRSVSQTSQASSPATTKPAKKTKVAAAPPPKSSTNSAYIIPDMSINDFSNFDLGLDALAGFDGLDALNDFNYDVNWDQQFVNYEQELAVPADYDFLYGLDMESSPSASSGSFYSAASSSSASSSSQSSPRHQLIPSFEPVPNQLVTGRPAICSREVTEGLPGYSQAGNGQDTSSHESSARRRAAGRHGGDSAATTALNTATVNRSAPNRQDGVDDQHDGLDYRQDGQAAAGLGNSSEFQRSMRSRPYGQRSSYLTDSSRVTSTTASRAQETSGPNEIAQAALESRLAGHNLDALAKAKFSATKASGRSGPAHPSLSGVPGGSGPLRQIDMNIERPPALQAATAIGKDADHGALASYRSRTVLQQTLASAPASAAAATGNAQRALASITSSTTGVRQTVASATGALLPASTMERTSPSAIVQTLQFLLRLAGSEAPASVVSSTLAILSLALGICALFWFCHGCSFPLQSALFVAPFAAKRGSEKTAEKWHTSKVHKQASSVDQRLGGLWQTARLSLRV